MTAKRQNRFASLRALCAAFALLFSAVAAPVALASRSSNDVCTMACCIKEGHCCCQPRRAHVAGETPDGKPQITETAVAAPCPEGCAVPATSSPLFARDALRHADHRIDGVAASLMHWPPTAGLALAATNSATAPRAPPVHFTHLAN